MKKTMLIALAIALTVAMALPARADIYIEQLNQHTGSSSRSESGSGITKMWISEQAIRVEEPGGKTIHITDLEGRRLITLDMTKREYFIIPLEQIRNDLERASARLKERMQITWEVEHPGTTMEVSGYLCRPIVFRGSGEMDRGMGVSPLAITIEFWVSGDAPVSFGAFLKMMDVIGAGQNPFMDATILQEIRNLGGFPIRTVTSIDMESINDRIEQTIQQIREQDFDPNLYAIPAGFREADKPPQY